MKMWMRILISTIVVCISFLQCLAADNPYIETEDYFQPKYSRYGRYSSFLVNPYGHTVDCYQWDYNCTLNVDGIEECTGYKPLEVYLSRKCTANRFCYINEYQQLTPGSNIVLRSVSQAGCDYDCERVSIELGDQSSCSGTTIVGNQDCLMRCCSEEFCNIPRFFRRSAGSKFTYGSLVFLGAMLLFV